MSISFSSLHLPLSLSLSSSISLIHSLHIFSTRKVRRREKRGKIFFFLSLHVMLSGWLVCTKNFRGEGREGESVKDWWCSWRGREERDEEEGCWKKRRKRGRREQTKKKGMEGGMMPKMDRIFEITRLFLIFVIRIKGSGREKGGLIERTCAKSEKDESVWNGWSERKKGGKIESRSENMWTMLLLLYSPWSGTITVDCVRSRCSKMKEFFRRKWKSKSEGKERKVLVADTNVEGGGCGAKKIWEKETERKRNGREEGEKERKKEGRQEEEGVNYNVLVVSFSTSRIRKKFGTEKECHSLFLYLEREKEWMKQREMKRGWILVFSLRAFSSSCLTNITSHEISNHHTTFSDFHPNRPQEKSYSLLTLSLNHPHGVFSTSLSQFLDLNIFSRLVSLNSPPPSVQHRVFGSTDIKSLEKKSEEVPGKSAKVWSGLSSPSVFGSKERKARVRERGMCRWAWIGGLVSRASLFRAGSSSLFSHSLSIIFIISLVSLLTYIHSHFILMRDH